MKTTLRNYGDAENFMYRSYQRAQSALANTNDAVSRDPQRTRRLLDLTGSPDEGMRIILVTGSKGKGSTSQLTSLLLRGLGFKVGLFTSPHLIHFTERIQVNGKAISQSDFLRLARMIEPHFQEIEAELNETQYQGPISLALSVALLYFREQGIDYAVIEAGRGGRFDDTNALKNEWAVISSILPEHLDALGPTVDDIIWHKTGIVKNETKTVIVNRQDPSYIQKVKRMIPSEKQLCVYGEQFRADGVKLSEHGTAFQLQTSRASYSRLHLPLLGAFQAYNAATALSTCEAIIGDRLPERLVQKTLAGARWPGRCEIVSYDPTVIVDGAINAVSAEYIKELVEQVGFRKVISIIGVPADKDYEGVIRTIATFSSQLIVSASDESHKTFPTDALWTARRFHHQCEEISPLEAAVTYANDQLEKDLLLIVGTQTFISDAKRLYR